MAFYIKIYPQTKKILEFEYLKKKMENIKILLLSTKYTSYINTLCNIVICKFSIEK